MPRVFDLDDVVALLESGTNIVTTRGELFGGGHRLGDEGAARVLDACARGGSSIYATGSSPGFITDALPFALLSLQRRVESVEIDGVRQSLAARLAAHAVRADGFRAAGGLVRSEPRPRTSSASSVRRSRCSRRPRACRSTSGRARARSRPRAARRRCVAGELPAGSVARAADHGRRASATGSTSCGSRPTGTARRRWSRRGIFDRRGGACGCAVTRRSTSTSCFPCRSRNSGRSRPRYTANRPVNAIPYVCAAAARASSRPPDLPPITPAGPPRVAGEVR